MDSLSEQYEAQQALGAEEQRPPVPTVKRLAIAGGVVLAVLALGLVVPKLVPKSDEQRYLGDRKLISEKVSIFTDAYCGIEWRFKDSRKPSGYGSTPRECQKSDYPVFALRKQPELIEISGATRVETDAALKEEDAGSAEITTLGGKGANLVGGTEHGGTPFWEDVDGDGRRVPGNEKLFYHDALPSPTVDHWNTTTVTRVGIFYVVDSRDWFIDIDMLVENNVLKRVPGSVSPDNSVHGKGSYSWYMDENGNVKSMLYSNPKPKTDGFQAVYP